MSPAPESSPGSEAAEWHPESEPEIKFNLAEEFRDPEFRRNLGEVLTLAYQRGEGEWKGEEAESGFAKIIYEHPATGKLETVFSPVIASGEETDKTRDAELASSVAMGTQKTEELLYQRGIRLTKPLEVMFDLHFHPGEDIRPSLGDLDGFLWSREKAEQQGLDFQPVTGFCTAADYDAGKFKMLVLQEKGEKPLGRGYAEILESRVDGYWQQRGIGNPDAEEVAAAFQSIEALRAELVTIEVKGHGRSFRVPASERGKLAGFTTEVRGHITDETGF